MVELDLKTFLNMLKITFKEPQIFQEKADYGYGDPFECLFAFTEKIIVFDFTSNFYGIKGFLGWVHKDNIQSIEHVKPTEI